MKEDITSDKIRFHKIFSSFIVTFYTYPPSFIDRHSNGQYGSDGYDDSKFPVELKGPKDYCIRLEQIKGIQSLERKIKP